MVAVSSLRKPKLLLLFVVIILILSGGLILASKEYSFLSPKNKDLLVKQETEDLITKVGRHAQLPVNETPTIATVTDKEKLPPQPFYARAEKGDKILLFTKARKAYLYRPSRDKLIEVTPLLFESELKKEQSIQ